MNRPDPKSAAEGFTLIELMIVVAIIGILAAVAIPKFADMLRKSKEGATKGSLTNLRSVLTIYVSDNEGLTPYVGPNGSVPGVTELGVLIPKYIESIPTAKLGTYHIDMDRIITRGAVPDRGATAALYAATSGGWIYSSSDGGLFFVNCIHTDTKGTYITSW